MVYDAGAKEVHLGVSCPPITHPDFYGIDTPNYDELIASNKNIDDQTSSKLNELKKSLVITTGDNYVGAAKKQLREKMADLYSKVASSYDKPSANELDNLELIEEEMKSAIR